MPSPCWTTWNNDERVTLTLVLRVMFDTPDAPIPNSPTVRARRNLDCRPLRTRQLGCRSGNVRRMDRFVQDEMQFDLSEAGSVGAGQGGG